MRNLLFVFLFPIGLFSCTKPQGVQPSYISTAFKSYFDYQPGTYWIFYDSLYNYSDSVAVSSYTDQQVTTSLTSTEEVQINLTDYYLDSSATVSLWNMFLANNTCSINLLGSAGYTYESGDELVSGMPFRLGTYSFNSQTSGPVTWTTVLLPVYTLGAATFRDVYMVAYTTANGSFDTFFTNAQNGFIAILYHNAYGVNGRLFLTAGHIVH